MFDHNFPVNIVVDTHTKTLNSAKNLLQSKKQCVCHTLPFDTLVVVHTGGHAVAISEFTELPHPPLFDRSSEFYKHLRKRIKAQFSLVLVYEVDIDAST